MRIALFAFSALLAAASVTPAHAQDGGKAAFDKRCARCHAVEKAVEFLKAHPDETERATWLERKLARHHARDTKDRAAIIAFLERELAAVREKNAQ